MVRLEFEYVDLTKTKSKTEQQRILQEIEASIAQVQDSTGVLKRELARTDLNALERFNFEESENIGQVFIKDLQQFETKVKAIQVQ